MIGAARRRSGRRMARSVVADGIAFNLVEEFRCGASQFRRGAAVRDDQVGHVVAAGEQADNDVPVLVRHPTRRHETQDAADPSVTYDWNP
jgi:hypothetical protein